MDDVTTVRMVPRSPDARGAEAEQRSAMTALGLQGHIAELRRRFGGESELTAGVGMPGEAVAWIGIYEDGIGRGRAEHVSGPTWDAALAAAERYIDERLVARRDKLVRRMALAIIDATDAEGACVETVLRRTFRPAEIAEHGDAACARADVMAGRGRFVILAAATP